jgi:crotonobetainyl-CoA:carnitine CoA-transferase CaiB-like acyl-CoA transferase
MLDAVLAFLWASGHGRADLRGRKVSQRTAASFIDLIYETQNGFMTAAVMTNKEWAALTRALERPDCSRTALHDPRALRDENIDTRLQMTQDVLKTRTTEDWLERLEKEGVPCAPVLTPRSGHRPPSDRCEQHPARATIRWQGRLRQTRTAARFETPTVALRRALGSASTTGRFFAEPGPVQAETLRSCAARAFAANQVCRTCPSWGELRRRLRCVAAEGRLIEGTS